MGEFDPIPGFTWREVLELIAIGFVGALALIGTCVLIVWWLT